MPSWFDFDNFPLKVAALALFVSVANFLFAVIGIKDLWPRYSAWRKGNLRTAWNIADVDLKARGREIDVVKECLVHLEEIDGLKPHGTATHEEQTLRDRENKIRSNALYTKVIEKLGALYDRDLRVAHEKIVELISNKATRQAGKISDILKTEIAKYQSDLDAHNKKKIID